MTRQEFLQELRIALQGEVSQAAINEHIRYYENYIIEESRKGRSEEEVIAQLGNPRLIAKTLIDTTEQFGSAKGEEYYSESYRQGTMGNEKGFHADYSDADGWDVRFGKLKLNSWYGKLIMILLAIIIIVVAAHVVAFLLPVIIVIVMIVLIFSFIFGSRR